VKPLSGIRVLDLTRLLPGPYATLVLADLGAEVIRVEAPGDDDMVRALPPAVTGPGGETVGALYVALNRNKKSVALDLKKPEGLAAFMRLVDRADVVVEGFRPGVMDRLGIGWSALSARNARVSLCSLSGYGQTGPMSQRAGHDLNYIALAGLLGVGGPEAGPPAIPGTPVGDIGSSMLAVSSVLAALLARDRAEAREKGSGRGTHVDVSMYDAALALMIAHLPGLCAGGEMGRERVPLTGRDPNYRVYRTKDARFLSVAPLEPKFWARLVAALDRPDLSSTALEAQVDPGKRAALHETLEKIFAGKTLADWTAALGPADACIEPVLEGREVLEHPHAVARGVTLTWDDPRLGSVTMPRTTMRPWSEQTIPAPAPRPGEDGAAVLAACGFSADEIASLRASAILG
jgi:alpha-methylacyl-CoA racemase